MYQEIKIMSEKDIIKRLNSLPYGELSFIAQRIGSSGSYLGKIRKNTIKPGFRILAKLSEYFTEE